MPEELSVQIPYIEELINAMNIPNLRIHGVEADDIIASLAKKAEEHGFDVTIISGDKDLMQLVNDKTIMIDTLKNKIYNTKGVIEKLGVEPKHVVDYLSITGDASDNVPGVRGIGPKGAVKLISEFGTLENIYKKLDAVKNPKHLASLNASKDNALLSKELIILKDDLDVDFSSEKFKTKEPDAEKLKDLYQKMEFISELRELKVANPKIELTPPKAEFFEPIKGHDSGDVTKISQYAVISEGMLIGHDLLKHFDHAELSKHKKMFDTKLAAYELAPGEKDYNIDDISIRTLGEEYSPEKLPSIMKKLDHDLRSVGLEKVYYDVDLPCIPVLKDIEETGALVDIKKLEKASAFFGEKIEEYTVKIHKEAGMEFNINSPKQLAYVLFDKIGLPTSKKTETGFSTDQGVLEELAADYELPKMIMEYRELTKLKSTYADPLLEQAKKSGGRIRTTYHLDTTATGRLSSSDPNLQNIPIRTNYGTKIREAFIADKDRKLISADYSQIELRIFAHLSQDAIMIESFLKGEDIHTRTASEIFDVPLELVTLTQRQEAKAVNFGIIYGKTPFGLARELGIPQSVAAKIIKKYFERYQGVAKVREQLIKDAKTRGYSLNMFGRRRYLPDINSKNVARRNFAERNAINAPIQGAAADIMKLAMVKVWESLKHKHPDTKIILNVHDELVVEVPESKATELAKLIKSEMEHVIKMSPPLTVGTNIGSSWLEAH
jgi:DNA polymerase-1